MARLIDADALEEKGVEFSDTNIYVPIEAVWDAPTVDAVILPCKPGDIVFYLNTYYRKVWPMRIVSVEINHQGISRYGCGGICLDGYTPVCFEPGTIGEKVFFTQEEAEAVLEKMKEADHGR